MAYRKQIGQRTLLTFLCIYLFNHLLAQSFIGKYSSTTESLHATISIVINKDKTYKFQVNKSVFDEMSQGIWKCEKDTIHLIDKLIEGFDIIVKESFDKSQQGTKFNFVIYPDSTIERDAMLKVNDDSSSLCLISSGQCLFEQGFIKKFRITIRENFVSKEYKVKSKRSNVFSVIINMNTPLAYYRILKDVRLVIKNDYTMELIYPPITSTAIPAYLYRTSVLAN